MPCIMLSSSSLATHLVATTRDLLVLADGGDLGSARALFVEHVTQKLLSQSLGELDTDDPLAEGEDLAVVGQD